MKSITSLGMTLATGLSLGACQHDSNRMTSNDSYSESDRARVNDRSNDYDNRVADRNRTNYDNPNNANNRSTDFSRDADGNRTNDNNTNTANNANNRSTDFSRDADGNRTNYNNNETAANRDASRTMANDSNPNREVDPNYANPSTGYDPNYINQPRETTTDGAPTQYTENRNLRSNDNRDVQGDDNRQIYGTTERYNDPARDQRNIDHSRDQGWRDDSRNHPSELGWRSGPRNSVDVVTLDDRMMYSYDDSYNRSGLKNRAWYNQQVVSMNESELPKAVKSTMAREADGAILTETGRTTWEGQQAYTASMLKQGQRYQVTTDANGELLAMRRVD